MAYQFSNFHKENIHLKNLQVKINKPYCHCKKGLVPAMLAMASYTGEKDISLNKCATNLGHQP